MRTKLLILVSMLCQCLGLAQENFQRTYGGVGDEQAHAVIVTHDGGIALAGHTNSFGAGGDDIFILKLNQQGVIQWQKTFGGPFDEYGFGVAIMETPNGDLVVTGLTNGNGPNLTDVYLFKTDEFGNLLWEYLYDTGSGGSSGDHGRGLLYTNDESIMLFGTDDGDAFGSNDGLAIKVDNNGTLLWKKVYGGTSNDHFQNGVELVSGNILICGSSQTFGPGNISAYLVKIDPDGNLIWANSYGMTGFEGFNSCDLTPDNNLIAAGISTSFGAGQSDMLLSKFDTAGTLLWSKTFGGSMPERAASVKAIPDGSGYVLVGYSDSFGNGSRDIIVIRTDVNGELVWSKNFGSEGYEAVNDWSYACLAISDHNDMLIAGWSDQLSVGGEDVVLLRSDLDGNALCGEVNMTITSPVMNSIDTETEVASPGTYSQGTSSIANASMISTEICHCIPECVTCEQAIVYFDLNACYSNLDDGSNMEYPEFIPAYPTELSFASISASTVHRENGAMNKHSCTPGVENSPAMCVSSLNSCTYDAGNAASVVFELTVVPSPDSSVQISSLSFYEKAPIMYNWINGASGLNNYPTRYGIRVLKNGSEIFKQEDIATSIDVWSNEVFDFSNDDAFIAEESTTFRFELLAYCVIGNIAQVNAWDLDEISVSVSCDPVIGASNNISGFVRNDEGNPLGNVDILLSHDPSFQSYSGNTTTDLDGQYTFKDIRAENSLYVKGYNNSNFLNGVTTLDLIYIQKHLLGLEQFTSPYQLIAADANRSNSVSVLDIHWLRSLILGRITELPDNTSWRFVDANQELSIDNPWNCQEVSEMPNIGVDIGNAHFVGIKVGDVTYDAETTFLQSPQDKIGTAYSGLTFNDQDVVAGVSVYVEVNAHNFQDIVGFQCALSFKESELSYIEGVDLLLSESDFHYNSEHHILSLSWTDVATAGQSAKATLFGFHIVPFRNGRLSEMIQIASHIMNAEVYRGEKLAVGELKLNITDPLKSFDNLNDVYNTPNPFTMGTTLHFELTSAGPVEIVFYNSSGQKTGALQREFSGGKQEISLSQKEIGVKQGIVYCQIITSAYSTACKMAIFE